MSSILRREFFERSAPEVGRDLLGKWLVGKYRGREISAYIVEVEAYDGFKDRASHASRGKTLRNQVMFGSAGIWYVYLIYGVYWMLNVVTGPRDYPSAVLIRAVSEIRGPGKLTKYFKINKAFNGKQVNKRSGLWVEDRGEKVARDNIKATRRVGVEYAGQYWSCRKWRFILKGYGKSF